MTLSTIQQPLDWNNAPDGDTILRGPDPRWFFELFCKIPTQDKGTVEFDLWPWMHNIVTENSGLTDKEIVLKSRDVGSSTFWVAESIRGVLGHEGRNLLIAADQQKSAVNLLNYARTILESLPDSARPHIDKNNTEEIFLDKLNARIAALPGTPDTGRSWRAYYLVCTEMAFWKNPRRYRAAVFATLAPGGLVRIDSTANGVGNLYHEVWESARAGLNGYRPTFIGVWENPNHTSEWYTAKKSEYTAKDRADHLFFQEYPQTEEEAFLSSADNYFSQDLILSGQIFVSPAVDTTDLQGPSGEQWGNVRVWKRSVPGMQYVAGVDVAEGKGVDEDSDWSHVSIHEWRTGDQVAAIHSRQPDDQFAETLYQQLVKYNNAHVAVERNGPGLGVIRSLEFLGHKSFFYHQKVVSQLEQEARQTQPQIGWHTTSSTKPYLLSDLSVDLKAYGLLVHDYLFWDQAKTFDRTRLRARVGFDDAIMATAIANQARRQFQPQTQNLDAAIDNQIYKTRKSWSFMFKPGQS